MFEKRVRLIASIALLAVLAVAMVLIQGRSTTEAAGSPLAAPTATPTPAAQKAASAAQAAGTASADPATDTTFASVDLRAGFILDPYLLPVVGGGDRAASDVLKGCNGFVSIAPDVVVNWSGEAAQLSFFVYSDADPVLVIQQPDGSFVCNDDAGLRTIDPLVVIKNPAEGAYKIHVGTAVEGEPVLGFLATTALTLDDAKLAELDLRPMLTRRERPKPQPLPQLDPSTLLTAQTPIFGSVDLQTGFNPVQTFAAGGGDIAAFTVKDKQLVCAGFVSLVPSYSFTWTGKGEALRLFFDARKDSSLAVVTPDQDVLCNMNAAGGNLNPVLDIPAPIEGAYKVYVAAMQPNTVVAGRLTITGDTKAAPATLAPAK